MKRNSMFSRLATTIAVVAFLMVTLGQNVHAAGTAAGTSITNTASVTFNDGSNIKNKNSNTVQLYVAHHVTAAFAPVSGQSTTSVDNATYYYAVDFQNTGNRADAYNISFNAPTGYTLSLINDDNADGVHQAGEVTPVATTSSITADGHGKYFIKAVIATLADNNNQDVVVTFTSTAADNVPGHIVVSNPGAAFAFTLHSTISKPVITITATETAPTPLIPGATFNYALAVQNSGSASATGNATFAYTVPTNMVFNGGGSGSYTANPGSFTVGYTYAAGVITFTVPNAAILTGVAQSTFSFPVIIEQTSNNGTGPASGQPIGTAITNFGNLTYNNGQNNLTATPSIGSGSFTSATTIATSIGGKWTVTPVNGTAAADEVLEYVYTLKNMGNTASTFTIADVQNGGTYNTDHLVALSSYGADLTTNPTGSVAAGSTIQIFVRVTVPSAATAAQTIIRTLTVTSTTTGTIFTGHVVSDDNHTVTTTVQAATFTINLSVSAITGAGTIANPAPGDVLTFDLAIQNLSATTAVSSVAIQNVIPTNMTYVPTSIKIGAIAQTDAPDGDNAEFSANAVKTETTLSVPASTTVHVYYQCTVN